MTQTAHAAHIDFLGSQTRLAPVPAFALYLAVVVTKWSMLRRSRRALSHLEQHLLDDIGLNRQAAQDEARRMFWIG
ncbi:DUF1127 domain-containing protein [Puniceibacterium sp. IMCC21224]|uniref:DUF1127 domain-containing protein n=1 Tax=Puniceibacterium sp. IMCC21224 TaxID=1618204 RepID=UPI00064DC830|nr:DUF1127 domain-containing protein [Puniceibacterium sp. IMCC21224]KMK67368.1 hypothetical protein IMCC21224_112236 [Puniceibacterium sp. IMCC21224]